MTKLCSHFIVGLACFGVIVSQPASLLLGASPTVPSTRSPRRPVQHDVELTPQGDLYGRVVDGQGRPQAAKSLLITRGRDQFRTVSDRQGNFRVPDVRGGTYLILAERSSAMIRAWKAGTAPPNAPGAALIVTDNLVMRGQCGECVTCAGGGDCGGGCVGGYGLFDWISDHPVLSYSLLTAAVAVPIIIAADDDDGPAS